MIPWILNTRYRPLLATILLFAWALLIFLCVNFVDLPVTIWAKENIPRSVFHVFVYISKLGEGTFWVILAFLIYLVPNYLEPFWRKLRVPSYAPYVTRRYHLISIYLLISLSVGGVITNILKHIIGRPRPTKFFKIGAYDFEGLAIFDSADSFPSGHTQVIWAATFALALCYPKYRWGFLFLALLVSLSRIIVLKHWVGDVIAGAGVSMIAAICLYHLIFSEDRGVSYFSESAKSSDREAKLQK